MTVLNTETRRALRLAIDQRRRELEELPARDPLHTEPWHGTAWAYRKKKCRCTQCREAASRAKRKWRATLTPEQRERENARSRGRRAKVMA